MRKEELDEEEEMRRISESRKAAGPIFFLLILAVAIVACAPEAGLSKSAPPNDATIGALSGNIRVHGSSTVFPITEAVAEEFEGVYRHVRVTVGLSDTAQGFQRFTSGETDICDASRPIKESEIEAARNSSIEYLELKVGLDKDRSRPVFIYVNKESLNRPEVLEFVRFYLTQGPELIAESGYSSLARADYDQALAAVEEAIR